MTVYVFVGPTLSPAEARRELDAVYLPPVSEGDIYRLMRSEPEAIGIVDGYFERVPAVWHKEILWALSRGVHVFGSASMGALRAAELAPFGMEGVGEIFAAFRAGALEDDDEVAVAHGLADSEYRAISEAMVNIRPTLAKAQAAGVLSATSRRALERIAKVLFYPDRSYPLIVRKAREQGLPASELSAFHDWLPSGRVDQKREDALAMLRTIRARLATGLGPKEVRFTFEHTIYWDAAVHLAGLADPDDPVGRGMVSTDALLDEARLEGAFPRLLARARDKRRTLESHGWRDPEPESGPSDAELLSWYLGRLGRPDDGDFGRHGRELGFADDAAFRRALLRERCYVGCTEGDA